MYFMSATMTTIGYGEINAAKYPDYSESDNMMLICFLQFVAILTFSLIQYRLFQIESDESLSDAINKAVSETQNWLNDLDVVIRRAWEDKKKSLPKNAIILERKTLDDKVWYDTIYSIESYVHHSCFDAFIKKPFYKELPPRIQSAIVKECL